MGIACSRVRVCRTVHLALPRLSSGRQKLSELCLHLVPLAPFDYAA